MRARAPGKLVLSGSYAVLEGAPAVVAAVDRYAIADSEREAPLVTEEVRAAIEAGHIGRAPWFDASALRHGDRKLGLGSSAAILVASLAAMWLERGDFEEGMDARLFAAALPAHRTAQAGGSGVDVAASCFGGVLTCRLARGGLEVAPTLLPADVVMEIYACGEAARTATMLEAVRAFAAGDAEAYRAIVAHLARAAEAAVSADDARGWVTALAAQADGLAELGRAAKVPIVTAEVATLDALARRESGCFLPSGAGGGDIAFFCGVAEPGADWRSQAEAKGLTQVALGIGAGGAQAVGP